MLLPQSDRTYFGPPVLENRATNVFGLLSDTRELEAFDFGLRQATVAIEK